MLIVGAVLGVALLIGFDPAAGLGDWFAAGGVTLALAFSLTWLAVALGQASGSVETASNVGLPLVLLPFLGSGFVPTDSMPGAIRWFAEYQPFTPIIDSLRGLLMGTRWATVSTSPSGGAWSSGWAATCGRRSCTTASTPAEHRRENGPPGSFRAGRAVSCGGDQARSKRSSSMTLVQACTKSATNFSRASWLA